MTTREVFLGVVHERLRQPASPGHLRPIGPVSDEALRYGVDLTDLQAAFVTSATAAGAEMVGGPDEEVSAVVERVLDEVEPSRAVVAEDSECHGVAEILARRGVEVVPLGDPISAAKADLGITGAVAGVSLTGSLVVDSARARTRLASLLPEVHLALLSVGRFVKTPGEVFRSLSRDPDGPPSNLVFITGPSRSADIELEITIGVHGPRRVLIALL